MFSPYLSKDTIYVNSDKVIWGNDSSLYDIGVYRDKLYLPDWRHYEIDTVDLKTNEKESIKVKWGHGIRINQDGIYIAPYGVPGIKKFTHDWKEIEGWDKDIYVEGVTSIDTDCEGNVYIVDYHLCNIVKTDKNGRQLISWSWDMKPHNILVKDRVYIADRKNSAIQIFSLNGVYIETWQVGGDSLAIRPFNDLFLIVDYENNVIKVYTKEGRYVKEIVHDWHKVTNLIQYKEYIYTTEEKSNRVQRIKLN